MSSQRVQEEIPPPTFEVAGQAEIEVKVEVPEVLFFEPVAAEAVRSELQGRTDKGVREGRRGRSKEHCQRGKSILSWDKSDTLTFL